jgi:hypothetical protein
MNCNFKANIQLGDTSNETLMDNMPNGNIEQTDNGIKFNFMSMKPNKNNQLLSHSKLTKLIR